MAKMVMKMAVTTVVLVMNERLKTRVLTALLLFTPLSCLWGAGGTSPVLSGGWGRAGAPLSCPGGTLVLSRSCLAAGGTLILSGGRVPCLVWGNCPVQMVPQSYLERWAYPSCLGWGRAGVP